MKKIFTTIVVIAAALSMQASLHLTMDKWVGEEMVSVAITKDTTIVVTEYEWDEDMEEATMGIEGEMYSDDSENIVVKIERSAEGILDQFCAAGNCVPGNGEKSQELSFVVLDMEEMRGWFTHYTPAAIGTETIVYTFNDGVNPAIVLTVEYNYAGTAVENVVVGSTNGLIYNLLGQLMPTNTLAELPAGVYVIDGKKYIKK